MATKPSAKPDWTVGNSSFSTVTIEPNGAKKQTGWQAAEKPAYQYMNWLFYIVDAWVDYFEDPVGQIATKVFGDSPVTATSSERWLAVDTSGGAVTINLPAVASNAGVEFLIIKKTSDANAVTIDANSTETINGELTYVLQNQYDAVLIKEISGQWVVVNQTSKSLAVNNRSASFVVNGTFLGEIINCVTTSSSFAITLPTARPGFNFLVKDKAGAFNSNPVVITRAAAESIEGVASNYTCNASFGTWRFYSDGTDWFIV